MKYNIFVDESCHLEHDRIPVMCIGYVKVPVLAYEELKEKLAALKAAHHTLSELKWNKFSASRLPLYKALVDFFFANPLQFRCVLVKYKNRLRHEDFNRGSHDNFYYKLTYFLLNPNPPGSEYRVFLDIKDTRGKQKLLKIEEVFENRHRGASPFLHFQHLRSTDNLFFQLADLFIGAVTYKARRLQSNPYKLEFIKYLELKSGFSLDESTPPWETKFNIFDHQPRKQADGVA